MQPRGGMADAGFRPRRGGIVLSYHWSLDGNTLRVTLKQTEILLITAAGKSVSKLLSLVCCACFLVKTNTRIVTTGEVTLDSGGYHNFFTLLGFNAVLQLLGMKVEEQEERTEEEATEDRGQGAGTNRRPWVVKKGSWSQDYQDRLKVSAFASREWPRIKIALEKLPEHIHPEDVSVGPIPPTMVLGKRELPSYPVGSEEGGRENIFSPHRGGGRGGARGTGRPTPNLYSGTNKWYVVS